MIETNNLKGKLPAVPVCSRRQWRCDSPRAVKRAMRKAFHSGSKTGGQWDDAGHGMEGAGALKLGCSNFFNV